MSRSAAGEVLPTSQITAVQSDAMSVTHFEELTVQVQGRLTCCAKWVAHRIGSLAASGAPPNPSLQRTLNSNTVRRRSKRRCIFGAMKTVDELEQAVRQLSAEELAEFRRWFASFDAAVWDAQLEADVAAGKLDALADEALDEFRQGRAKSL